MKKLSKEDQQALKDRDFWVRVGKPYGWRLIGFNYRHTASFAVGNFLTTQVDSAILQALLFHRQDLWDEHQFIPGKRD